MSSCTLAGEDNSPVRRSRWTNEIVSLDWDVEHKRFEREMFGLVRALGFKAYKRAKRPKVCWNDMVDDACIFAWRAWRSLRLRGLDPQAIGAYAIADRAVLSTLQGARFQPLSARGDRSHADSIYNRRNGVKVRSNKESWQLEGAVGDGQEESDLIADWESFKAALGGDDRQLVESLEANDVEALSAVKSLKRRKRLLADQFRAFRAG